MDKIIGIGNALVDALVLLQDENMLQELHLPKGSMQLITQQQYQHLTERTQHMHIEKATGGSAANTILSLAKLSAKPGFIGKVSQDTNGAVFVEKFQEQGVQLQTLLDTLPTGICTSFITPDGERTMATFLGAAANLTPQDITPALFAGYNFLYIEGYLVQNHALITCIIDTAKAAGLQIVLDLASYNIVQDNRDFFIELLTKIDIVFANEEECLALRELPLAEAIDDLATRCQVAVVKVGKAGVWVKREDELVQVAACEVPQVIDTTGAGDAFAAGFLYAYARHCSLERCAVLGNLLASEVIQVLGASLPDHRLDQIVAKVQKVLHA